MSERKKPRKQRRLERRETQLVAAWTRVAIRRWNARGAERERLMREVCMGTSEGPVWVVDPSPLVSE